MASLALWRRARGGKANAVLTHSQGVEELVGGEERSRQVRHWLHWFLFITLEPRVKWYIAAQSMSLEHKHSSEALHTSTKQFVDRRHSLSGGGLAVLKPMPSSRTWRGWRSSLEAKSVRARSDMHTDFITMLLRLRRKLQHETLVQLGQDEPASG